MADQPKHKYSRTRAVQLTGGGSARVTVSQPDPFDERDFMILRPGAVEAMAECFTDLANAMRPLDSRKIVL